MRNDREVKDVRLFCRCTFFKNEGIDKMNQNEVIEILDCLPKERTLFRYFKGRYALMLLKHFIGNGTSVSDLRKSMFSTLLEKPEVKEALATAGKGLVTSHELDSVWSKDTFSFVLTSGIWGSNCHRWDQTSRRGYNLVLQLNFSSQHDDVYRKMVQPMYEQMLNHYAHPVLEINTRDYFRETLAWSRIDLDFSSEIALIEEIQCDWLRKARFLLAHAIRSKVYKRNTVSWNESSGKVDDVINYCENVLQPYQKIWDEAMLAATIDFIKKELGFRKIYYHSDTTGYRVKNIRYDKPPRSLYSKLPNKFCFLKTKEAPEYLYQDKYFRKVYKKLSNPVWYYMSI